MARCDHQAEHQGLLGPGAVAAQETAAESPADQRGNERELAGNEESLECRFGIDDKLEEGNLQPRIEATRKQDKSEAKRTIQELCWRLKFSNGR